MLLGQPIIEEVGERFQVHTIGRIILEQEFARRRIPTVPPTIPPAHGVPPVNSLQSRLPLDPDHLLDTFEPPAQTQLPAKKAKIHMWLVEGKLGKVCPQTWQVKSRPIEGDNQIIAEEFVVESTGGQRLPAHQAGHGAVGKEADDRDVESCRGFNVEIDRPRSQPFIQSPVVPAPEALCEKPGVLPPVMILREPDFLIAELLAPDAEAGHTLCAHEIGPGQYAARP